MATPSDAPGPAGRDNVIRRAEPRAQAMPPGAHRAAAPAPPGDEAAATGVQRPGAAVPPEVAERFVRLGNRYYRPDRGLAFTDHGERLTAATSERDVVQAVVAVAAARGWAALAVSGQRAFRQAVWEEASRRGLEVRGYTPDALERAALDPARAPLVDSQARSPRPSPAPRAQHPGLTAGANAAPQREATTDGGPPEGVAFGVLVAHGAAAYRFEAGNPASYHVRLRTPQGDRTFWGAGLARAMNSAAQRVRVGDEVGVAWHAASPRAGAGAPGGTWSVEPAAVMRARAREAQALRRADPLEAVVRAHPDLVEAAVTVWLAEQLAAQRIERPADRARFVGALRERLARAIEAGVPIRAPALRAEAAARLDAERAAPAAVPPTPEPRAREVPAHAR